MARFSKSELKRKSGNFEWDSKFNHLNRLGWC